MHLEIKQSTSGIENVSTQIIDKLYELAYEDLTLGITSQLDSTSVIQGRVSVNACYENRKNFLTNKFNNFFIDATSLYVNLKDSYAEQVAITRYSSDGIGLTDSDAARVTSMGDVFKNNTDIVNMSDFGTVFHNCTQLNQTFYGCSNLKTIDISNVVTLDRAFCNCTSLEMEINAPNLTGELLGNNLTGCFTNTKITNIINIGNISTIGVFCFANCSLLTEVNIPQTVTEIKNSGFENCSSLSSISTLENVQKLGGAVFAKCSGLSNTVLNLKNVYEITDKNPLFGGSTIGQIYLPRITSSHAGGSYYNAGYSVANGGSFGRITSCKTMYFKNLTKLYPASFSISSITALVINNNTPPTLCNKNDQADADVTDNNQKWNTIFNGFVGQVYVPDASISTYQNDNQWSTLGITFKGISELTRYQNEEAWIAAGRPALALIEEYM